VVGGHPVVEVREQLGELLGEVVGRGLAAVALQRDLTAIAEAELAPDLRPKGDASDLVQEAFLEASRDLRQFTGCTAPEWQAWLRQIVMHNVHELVDRYRGTAKRNIDQEVSLNQGAPHACEGPDFVADVSSPSSMAMRKELAEVVHVAMSRLSERDRQVLILRFQDQCTYEEMGQRLGCSAPNACKAWHKAIERLRKQLDFSSTPV